MVKELVAENLDEVGNLILRNGCGLVLADGPDRLHHAHEVQVVGNAHAEVGVVIHPLGLGHLAVLITLDAFKAVKEVFQNLLAGLLAVNEVLVAAHIEDLIDVLDANYATVVLVHQGKGLFDHELPAVSEGLAQSTHELVERDVTIVVNVIELHEGLDFNNFWENAEGVKSLSEL